MTDAATDVRAYWQSEKIRAQIKRRHARDHILQWTGLGAILLALLLLAILMASLIALGHQAFVQTKVELNLEIDAALIDTNNPFKGNYRKITRDAFKAYFPEVTDRRDQRELYKIMSTGAQFIVRRHVVENPQVIGKTIKLKVPLSDPFDQLNKKVIPPKIDALTDTQQGWLRVLERRGVIKEQAGRPVLELDLLLGPETLEAGKAGTDAIEAAVQKGFQAYFPNINDKTVYDIADESSVDFVRRHLIANPDAVGKTIRLAVPLSANYEMLHRGTVPKITNPRFKSDKVVDWFDTLDEKGLISTPFNWELLSNADSRFPELAGLSGALWGSFYALLVCFLISFPVGIAAAIYLEEFAPKNRWTDLIEVNINNLAAVPSIIFGLLGLSVLLGTFALPRSAPLVGGMTLALMTLPTIIIVTRAALGAVPPSIREAALGVGASRHQVVMHHVLPLAMPGILTGTIIGLARALGETAPLLLIGMNAFITSASGGIMDPATALPTQIFIWADSPERGFMAKTSAGILVLLGFLVLMNGIAVFLRNRFERRW